MEERRTDRQEKCSASGQRYNGLARQFGSLLEEPDAQGEAKN